jgi:hypothetical protein
MMGRAANLLDRARATASLDHFGDDGFREGLERLVDAVDREARLTDMGHAGFDAQIVDLLVNRLQVEDWYRRHPEIDEQEIVAPLIGLGLPRTGSTALSHMLGEDPAARSVRGWEAQMPCPPPETAHQYDDPRIARAEVAMERRARMFPRMTAMLPSTATSPTECQTFMGYDFKTQLFQAFVEIPSYVEWLTYEADLVPTYHYVKRVLKLLQWRCPPTRWRLKNPSHILFIDALDKVFPDARFWMTHRPIEAVLPSVCDLYLELHQAFSASVEKAAIAAKNVEFCEVGMRRMIAFRDAGHDARFFDIQFAAFQADPVEVIADLYRFAGETLGATARTRMQAWQQAKPLEAQSYARTPMAEFGLDADGLRRRFAFYADRYAPAAMPT